MIFQKINYKPALASILLSGMLLTTSTSCNTSGSGNNKADTLNAAQATPDGYDPNFEVEAQSYADLQLLRYQVPGFQSLTLQQKQLAYYLYEAALCGRDIMYDQKSKNGLLLRKTLEAIYGSYKGEKTSEDWKKWETYCGRFWFSNGNHHHYGNEKFMPECPPAYFVSLLMQCDSAQLPKRAGETTKTF
ncbi:MAG: hypothetical protein EBX41_11105, partial [Chitinophagia bacterium]|nr:hypothetical protein [Chitinophagia bacterium]